MENVDICYDNIENHVKTKTFITTCSFCSKSSLLKDQRILKAKKFYFVMSNVNTNTTCTSDLFLSTQIEVVIHHSDADSRKFIFLLGKKKQFKTDYRKTHGNLFGLFCSTHIYIEHYNSIQTYSSLYSAVLCKCI